MLLPDVGSHLVPVVPVESLDVIAWRVCGFDALPCTYGAVDEEVSSWVGRSRVGEEDASVVGRDESVAELIGGRGIDKPDVPFPSP